MGTKPLRMMENPTVTISGTCPHCRGEKLVANVAWDLFFSWKLHWDDAHPRPLPRAHEAWARFLGEESRAEAQYWRDQGLEGPPPEQIPCPKCKGEGEISLALSLDEFAQMIFSRKQELMRGCV